MGNIHAPKVDDAGGSVERNGNEGNNKDSNRIKPSLKHFLESNENQPKI